MSSLLTLIDFLIQERFMGARVPFLGVSDLFLGAEDRFMGAIKISCGTRSNF